MIYVTFTFLLIDIPPGEMPAIICGVIPSDEVVTASLTTNSGGRQITTPLSRQTMLSKRMSTLVNSSM